MPATIARAQRDAIYEMVINHLTGIGDVWLAVHRQDLADAKRLGPLSPACAPETSSPPSECLSPSG